MVGGERLSLVVLDHLEFDPLLERDGTHLEAAPLGIGAARLAAGNRADQTGGVGQDLADLAVRVREVAFAPLGLGAVVEADGDGAASSRGGGRPRTRRPPREGAGRRGRGVARETRGGTSALRGDPRSTAKDSRRGTTPASRVRRVVAGGDGGGGRAAGGGGGAVGQENGLVSILPKTAGPRKRRPSRSTPHLTPSRAARK